MTFNGTTILCLMLAAFSVVRVRQRSKSLIIRCKFSSLKALERFQKVCAQNSVKVLANDSPNEGTYGFVWTSSRRSPYVRTECWNRLCGMKCLEDKRIMGEILQSTLEEFYLESQSLSDAKALASWRKHINSTHGKKRRWVLKDARSNGGTGLWFFSLDDSAAYEAVLAAVQAEKSEAGYTVQEYLPGRPLLWHGRKFHFRVAAVLTGDGRAFLHRCAFVHPANSKYTDDALQITNASVHITNLCVNLALNQPERFVGEIREDLINDRPELWVKMLQLWSTTVLQLRPFMLIQRSKSDFEYIGLDLIANDGGRVYLIEANCPPAVSSATGFAHAENMHDEILGDLFRGIVLPKVLGGAEGQPQPHWWGGFVECTPNYAGCAPIEYTGDYHQAQARCDVAIMRYLSKRRRENCKVQEILHA